MSIFNETNQKRVAKICDIVDHLRKSVASNKATPEQAWELLEPALTAIGDLIGAEAQPPSQDPEEATPAAAPQASEPVQNEPTHITIRRLAQEASFKDLTMAMAVYIGRIEEELS